MMNNERYFYVLTEAEIQRLGVKGYLSLRKEASKNGELYTLLDIAVYRFLHEPTDAGVLSELFYLIGRTGEYQKIRDLLTEYEFYVVSLPEEVLKRANRMLNIGLNFPYLKERDLQYLETIWCESKSYEWMDIIMFDEDMLPRQLKRFDKESLNIVNNDFEEDFLLKVYECFELTNKEPEYPYIYDRKNNSIRKIYWDDLGGGEYLIKNRKEYKEMYEHFLDTYGDTCANYFAEQLCPKDMEVGKFKMVTFKYVYPWQVVAIADNYFNNLEDVVELKKWFALDFLKRCNEPSKNS